MNAQGEADFRCLSHLETVLIGSSLEPDSNPVVSTGAAVARAAGAKIDALDFLVQLKFLHSDMPWATTSQQVESHAARTLGRFILENCEEGAAPVHAQVRAGDARVAILSGGQPDDSGLAHRARRCAGHRGI